MTKIVLKINCRDSNPPVLAEDNVFFVQPVFLARFFAVLSCFSVVFQPFLSFGILA